MLIAQLSDLHTVDPDTLAHGVADSNAMLEAAVDHLLTLKQQPSCVVITGDLVSAGQPGAYGIVRDALMRLPMPVYVLPGNHDDRKLMKEYLGRYCPNEPEVEPFLCYTVEDGPVRLVMLDTVNPGSHTGRFDRQVLDWLNRTLAIKPAQPTLVFMHHPPFWSGMGGKDSYFANLPAFAHVLHRNPQVRLCCGHLHRSLSTMWENRVCVSAPSTSMQVMLDLSPEGGSFFCMEAPGYLLHHFTEDALIISHTCQIPGKPDYAGPYPFGEAVNPE